MSEISSLLTVIIPVYNAEDYLEECLNSVINQTYRYVEIIVVNDGSTDDSLMILNKYSTEYGNIKVISQENAGQSSARNRGIEHASGKYISFIDADDYILPNTFEELVGEIEDNYLDLIRFSAEPFTDNMKMNLNKKQYNFDAYFDSKKVYSKAQSLQLNNLYFSPSPVLFILKKDTLINNNIRFKPGIIHEDELFTVEIFLNVNNMMYKPSSFYKRRYRPSSTMTSKSILARKKSFDSKCVVLDELHNLFSHYNKKNEIALIKKRIRVITASLFNNYDEIDMKYKMSHIPKRKKITFLFYYYRLKKTIKSSVLKIDKSK